MCVHVYKRVSSALISPLCRISPHSLDVARPAKPLQPHPPPALTLWFNPIVNPHFMNVLFLKQHTGSLHVLGTTCGQIAEKRGAGVWWSMVFVTFLSLIFLVMRSSWGSGWSGCSQVLLICCLISLIINQISRLNVSMGYTGISEQVPRGEEGFGKIHRNYLLGKVISDLQRPDWVYGE